LPSCEQQVKRVARADTRAKVFAIETDDDTMTDDRTTDGWIDNESAALSPAWHVVAASAEVTDAPLQVWLLGRPWVLVRHAGSVFALEDRCPHRRAPLSAGTFAEGSLRCAYHGWQFGSSGQCVHVPALRPDVPIPPRAAAATPFAVQERFGLVWLAPDEPVCDIHPFPEWDDRDFHRAWTAPRRTTVSAAQLADNFLDASHFPTVHTQTFGTPEAAYVSAHTVERRGWEVRTVYEAPYRNHDDPLVASGVHPLVQPHVLTKVGRPAASVYLTLDFPMTGSRLAILFVCQPETRQSTRIYKLMARRDTAGPAGLDELVRYEELVLDEDLAILERYPSMRLAATLDAELHTRADRLSVAYRRVLGELTSRALAMHGGTT
jgi:phenylpropionate dioxygenase-like ring-hydroxylating dioxygenase large terminal subunit